MQHVNLIKNLFSIILIAFLSITAPAFAQEVTEAQVFSDSPLSILTYKNISPANYDYYNAQGLGSTATRVFLSSAALMAILGGFFATGAMEFVQNRVTERESRRVPDFASGPAFSRTPALRLNLRADSFGKKHSAHDK